MDFGGISAPLSAEQKLAQPDMIEVPILSYAVAPAYNVRCYLLP